MVLVKPGSGYTFLYAFDMEQRHVGLSFTIMPGPARSSLAPAGYGVLFLSNKAGTPSLATGEQVSGAAAAVGGIEMDAERVPTPA